MSSILVIDDEQPIREVLREVLEHIGYKVFEATNGIEGLQVYRDNHVDLVVTDIIMPQKGGLDTIMDLRNDFPDVRIVAISGGGQCGETSYLELAMGVGADRAIGKPFVLDEFLEAVEELLASPDRRKDRVKDRPETARQST